MPLREEDIMAETMSETTPEGRAQSAMTQIEPVLDDAAAFVDEAVAVQAPVGRYTSKRLNALAKVLNKVLKEVGSDVEFDPVYENVTDEPLPDALVRGLMGVVGVVDTFAAMEPEEVDITFDIKSIVDDKSLAFATAQLDNLFNNRRFKKFLREEEPTVSLGEEAPVEEEIIEEEIIEEEPITNQQVESQELDILSML
tara:strand:+ start:5923 stop:6516 length:594 start_codon:yes stop_codon:yes gene_type:complete